MRFTNKDIATFGLKYCLSEDWGKTPKSARKMMNEVFDSKEEKAKKEAQREESLKQNILKKETFFESLGEVADFEIGDLKKFKTNGIKDFKVGNPTHEKLLKLEIEKGNKFFIFKKSSGFFFLVQK